MDELENIYSALKLGDEDFGKELVVADLNPNFLENGVQNTSLSWKLIPPKDDKKKRKLKDRQAIL
ncbi:hypothetical protein SUGI_0870210, partial [Cryptomeria japonica]